MNYLLILGSISLCAFFIFIFLIRLSKIVQQNEVNDYIFGILGFLLVIVFTVITLLFYAYLEQDWQNKIVYYSDFYEINYHLPIEDIKENNNIFIQDGNVILNLIVDNDTHFVRNGNKIGKILVEVKSMRVPEAWYMMKYKVDYLNTVKYYYVREIYTE